MKLIVIGLAASAAIFTYSATSQPSNDDATGKIVGRVVFDGEVPEKLPALKIGAAEAKGCHDEGGEVDPTDRSLLIDAKGGICNAVISIDVKGAELVIPEEPIVLDQKGCRFEPHVVVVPEGATIRFKNSDGVNHNVHTYSRKNDAINKNISGGSHDDLKLDKSEDFEAKCDIHPWMSSYVYVSDSPFNGVSELDGSFMIEGLPPGEHKVAYWHETLGKGTAKVMVEAGGTAELEIKMSKSAKKKGGRGRRR